MVRLRGAEESVMGLLWRMNAALIGEVKQINMLYLLCSYSPAFSVTLKRHSYHTLSLKNVVYLSVIQ